MTYMKIFLLRNLYFILGIIINALGIALITKADLGTSPISSVPYVLCLHFTPTFGQFTFVMNMFFILAQILILRKRFRPIQFLQIGVVALFSVCIDIFMFLLSWVEPTALILKLAALLAGCLILAFGICIEVAPNVLMVPGEGLVQAIAGTFRWRFGTVKIAFDTTLFLIACSLSFAFSGIGNFVGLGVGTIISMLLVGRFVNLVNIRFAFIHRISALAVLAAWNKRHHTSNVSCRPTSH